MLGPDLQGDITTDVSLQAEVSQKKTLKVMYLFAESEGSRMLCSILRSLEEKGHFHLILEEIDIERGPGHDLRDEQLWESIHAKLQEGDWFLIVSPPCNTFSRARHQYRKFPGPRPPATGLGLRAFHGSVHTTNRLYKKRMISCNIVWTHADFSRLWRQVFA